MVKSKGGKEGTVNWEISQHSSYQLCRRQWTDGDGMKTVTQTYLPSALKKYSVASISVECLKKSIGLKSKNFHPQV